MKHIIIAGSARSGKTTLATMIKERFPAYNIFRGDCVREWFIALYGKKCASEIVHSDVYAEAIARLTEAVLKDPSQFYIIEWSRLFPETVEKLSVRNRCHAIYLGHGGIDAEALMRQCRKYERTDDFTASLSEDELLAACGRWTATDVRIMNECIKCQQKYYDTSADRMAVLKEITENIAEQV